MNDLEKQIKEVKQKAVTEEVPIMEDETINYISSLIKDKNIKSILEIGTAIGYSALTYIKSNPDLKIVTIEKDEKRYLEALENFKKAGVDDRVTIIYNDAIEVNLDDKFDLIILDGPKGQNISYFKKFSYNLNEEGIILTDNMNFHGYVYKDPSEIESRNLRQLVRKIKEYHEFLKDNKDFDTDLINLGDGIAVSKRI